MIYLVLEASPLIWAGRERRAISETMPNVNFVVMIEDLFKRFDQTVGRASTCVVAKLYKRYGEFPDVCTERCVKLYELGCDIKTQYDKPDDPPSKDATMILTVEDPLAEPMIHRDLPGGFEELQEYVMEVCEGIKDHCVRDPG